MPRSTVFAEQFIGSRLGANLCEHREDRDALLASWMDSLKTDPRIRAVWLWSSFEKGEADDLSDLDIWVIVADDAIPKART
jgi:predicted nucleotidyltransferase